MADLEKTIKIIFGGEDNVSYLTKDIDKSLEGLANSAEKATQPLANLATGILAVEASIAALGIAALNYTHNEAVAMESASSDLQKVLSDSEGSVHDYKEEIKQLSLEFGVAGVSTTQATADFRQAGFSIDESLGLVETALIGVKIAELDSTESSELLIRNLRGIGAEAEDAAHYMDAWNEVSNNYAATAKEVAIATGALSPIAKTAGLSFDELVGLVTPLVEVYGSGAEAANALKVGLANLISPTERVVSSLSELGIAQRDANGELRLSSDILEDLGNAWPTLTQSQQANYGILLFGKEQYARMSVVLNDYNKVLEITAVAENAAGSAKEELAIKLATAQVAADRFSVAMGYAADSVGQQFLDSSTKGVDAMANLATAFSVLVDGGKLEPLLVYLNELLDELEINLNTIANNLPAAFEGIDYSGLIKSFKEIGLEFGGIFGGVDLTTAEGLHEVIQKLVDSMATLNNVFAGVISGFSPVIEAFKLIAGSASDADSNTAKFIGDLIGKGAAINTFAGLLGGLTSAFGSLADAVILIAGAKRLG
ncbi:MAG: phage tail tape measure protein, partial [Gammaproteobacteria bacterium]